jgi:FlaA1/EpsC-like NDP-sugar epimerase
MRAVALSTRPKTLLQLVLVIASNGIAFLLRFDGVPPPPLESAFVAALPLLLVSRGLMFIPFRLYRGVWRYTSVHDLTMVVGGIVTSTLLFALLLQTPLGPEVYPRSIFVIDSVLLVLMLGGVRLTRRVHAEFPRTGGTKRVLIYGAGDAGELIVRDMKNNSWYSYQPIGFVDDDPWKVGRYIHGLCVLGTRDDLQRIFTQYKPHEVLLAMPRADAVAVRSIVKALERFHVPIKTLPNLRDLIDGKIELAQIRDLAVEDLLARAPVGLDRGPVRSLIKGRRVMVTGAGGSIGSELCRQIVKLQPASLVMFERYENSLHAVRLELEDQKHACQIHPVIGDVGDAHRIGRVLETYRPEIVFHAAAHKHVPLMEENPCEAIKNNVRGTRVLAQAAELYGVDRFIFISTDKAVNPTSVMGASKRIAELTVQLQAVGSGTSFAVVRFGNVLGSNGSVVPRFLDQIKKGGPVTITHPEMRRFFMLIPEAVQLVLHAAAQAHGGATYVLEMGEQVKLVDMALDLIRLSGYRPEEIPIEFIGLRPGEKLFEELVGINEVAGPSAIEKIQRVTSRKPPTPDLLLHIEALEDDATEGDVEAVLARMRQIVPEYAVFSSEIPPAPAEASAKRELTDGFEGDMLFQHCPQCHTARLHRSKSRTIYERVMRHRTAQRLFKCDACGWRGWLLPLVSVPSDHIDAAAPDLHLLDRDMPAAGSHRRSFSPRDLH